jgi:formate C-acetyltransferase
MPIHPRNQRLKDQILGAPYEICVDRARYFTESFRRTEGEHPALRAAKACAHTMRQMTVYILDDEALVGNRSSKLVGAVIPVERGDINTVLELELDVLTQRKRQPFHIDPADRRELLADILPYWKGRTLRARKNALWKQHGVYFRPALNPLAMARRFRSLDMKRLLKTVQVPGLRPLRAIRAVHELLYNNPALVMNSFDVQGHLILGHKNVLREGFAGIRARAEQRRLQAEAEGDVEGMAFLEAVEICCEAMRDLALRYAMKAEELAVATADPARRRELEQIATRCVHVPYHPPRDFREAVQALWLTQVGGLVAYGMTGILAIGRFDQYLYPYYAADREAGRIEPDEACALMEELLLKLSSNVLLLPYVGKQTGNELGADSCSPTVGGVARDGTDGVNDLSYVILDAFTNVKATGNSFTIRLAENTPEDFWRQALATFRHTSGAALYCDEQCVEALKGCGVTEEDARDYGVIGCVEPTGDGDTFGCTSGNDISFTAALEMTLLDGYLRIMGRRIGRRTGDPRTFSSFEELIDAFKRQVVFQIDTVVRAVNLKDQAYHEAFPSPYVSATLRGCVDRARDMTQGGADYNFGSVSGRGLGTAVDSLAAIRHFVYETRALSMDRLLGLVETNFAGDDKTRARLAYRGPKYGCGDADADAIAKEIAEFFCREVAARQTIRGGPFRPSFFSYGMHVIEGLFLGATPDGRRAGEPVSNSFSPSNGAERRGPTAMLGSVAQIDHRLISNGCALNLKFLPSLFDGDERLDKMVALVRGFFAQGGMELQPNVVSNETLRDAQRHPDRYRDLVVRVSGYSAYFTDIGKPLQDEIISRTEFGRV